MEALSAQLELWRPTGVELIVLSSPSYTIGRSTSNDIALPDDKMASSRHAVVEALGTGWEIRDLTSRNGTFVRGERLYGSRALDHRDDVVIGQTKFVFHDPANMDRSETLLRPGPPALTPREREVLVALCRPLFAGTPVRVPATLRTIAEELSISQSGVTYLLGQLYDKFEIPPMGHERREVLASAAVDIGAVTVTDYRPS